MDRAQEIKRGLRETRKYVLSHHRPREYYRCYRFDIGSRTVRLCARCIGIYAGLLAGTALAAVSGTFSALATGLMVLPTAVEKYLTGVQSYRGYNSIRTATGFLLGAGYINGALLLYRNPLNPEILGLAGFSAGIAAVLILKSHKATDPK